MHHEDGRKIYDAIKEAFKKNQDAVLDFEGVDIVTSALLNTSIKILIEEYEYDYLKKHLKIINSTSAINHMLRKYLSTNN